MKQTVTDINDPSELEVCIKTTIEHYTFNSYFGNFFVDSSPNENVDRLSEIDNYKIVPFTGEIVHNDYIVNTNFRLDLSSWTLLFDRSKSKDGVDAGCVLMDPKGTKWMIACRL